MRLPEDELAAAWEMGTVEGSAADSARLLTFYHRPTSFQLVVPIVDGTCAAALAGLLGEVGGCLYGFVKPRVSDLSAC